MYRAAGPPGLHGTAHTSVAAAAWRYDDAKGEVAVEVARVTDWVLLTGFRVLDDSMLAARVLL